MDNPLIFGFALVAIDVALWRSAVPRNEVARLLTRLCIYGALSALLFSSGLSPFFQPPFEGSRALHVAGAVLEIIWWLTGARLLSVVLDTLFLPETWRRQRLFEDVFGAVAFLAAVVASLAFVLELPVRGLVATSGALAIVLGLAIQSTLSDVFAGIVINTTEPYEVGNWVSIDGVEGKVLEMNWRATHLLTGQGDVIIVPNAVAAKAKITNSSRPAALHGLTITLEITPEARPGVVLDALRLALEGVRAVLAEPAPSVLVKGASVQSLSYEVTAFVDDMGKKAAVSNELYDLCYRHLAAAGVDLRAPGASRPRDPTAGAGDGRIDVLRRVQLFAALPLEELARLAQALSCHAYEAGEVLITSGSVSDALMIVDSGVLSAVASKGEEQIEVARFGPGETCGEDGLLAGLAARMTVTALTNGVIYRAKKDALTPLFKNYPHIVQSMCGLLSRRQQTLDRMGTSKPAAQSEESFFQWLIDRVRELHDLTF
ncbi:mechanosensitive ion channel domain-containing protein [Paraburkholderia sp. EG287B]|uniref:mechanosensitive ion channel domain-containing protein n=1 Tax=Paraburkholderia sp. EG287B TaxID=3237010 RepID=UPI0034D2855A